MPYLKRLVAGAACLATAVGATMAAAAPNAAAAPIYKKNGTYQFASNTDTSGSSVFRISNSPFSFSDSSQSLGSNGVNLSITPDPSSGYADSGVIVDLGTLDSLFSCPGGNCTYVPPKITASASTSVNYYFDTDGNGGYLSFTSNGVYEGPGGDNLASISGDNADFNTFTQGNTSIGLTGTMTMEQVLAAYNGRTDGGTKDPEVWAWIGVSGSVAQSGYVTSVDGTPLVTEVPAVNPVKGLTATANYTNLTANWNASKGATSYKVSVTTHRGAVTVFTGDVTLTTLHVGRLKENTGYAVHVLAEPAAPGAKPATVDVKTK